MLTNYVYLAVILLCKSNDFANPVDGLGGDMLCTIVHYFRLIYNVHIHMIDVRPNLLKLYCSLFPDHRLLSVCHHQ